MPWDAGLGAHQHTFCSHLKTRIKQKFQPKYDLKCVVFGKKTVKIVSAVFSYCF